MNLKSFLFGKKVKREETLAYVLRKAGRIKELEKKCVHLEKLFREMQTDNNELAIRIMKLEAKIQKLEKKK